MTTAEPNIDSDRDAQLLEQYTTHKLLYDGIQERLDDVREFIQEAPTPVAETILFLADTYALISAQTPVRPHELAFVRVAQASSFDEMASALAETRARGRTSEAVLYHNNKAEYIQYNLQQVDYAEQVELFRAGDVDELHRRKVDDVKGVGMAKSAFSLAMCGLTEKMCVDANVARFFDLDPSDPREVPNTVVVERYERFCRDLREQAPTLLERYDVSNFLWQWVCFDARRDYGVETHDPWFLTVGQAGDIDLLGSN